MKHYVRIVHAFAVLALCALIGLDVFACLVAVLVGLFEKQTELDWMVVVSLGLAVLLVPGCVIGIWRYVSWRILVSVYVVFLGILGYFVYDGPRPPTPDFGPRGSSESKGYQTFLWMAKGSPSSRLAELPANYDSVELRVPPKRVEWPAFLAEKSEALERSWAGDRLGREWVDALSQAKSDGVVLIRMKDSILDFDSVRAACYARLGHVAVLAQQNRRGEAVRELLPLIRASYFIQRTSANLVHQMIGVVLLGRCYETANFILDRGGLADVDRLELKSVLADAVPMAVVFRNGILGDSVSICSSFEDASRNRKAPSMTEKGDGVDRFLSAIVPIMPVFYNPHRTERIYQQLMQEVSRLASERKLDDLDARLSSFVRTPPRFDGKNPAGRLIMAMAVPALQKVANQIWEKEDERLALLKRLGTP